MRVERAHRGRTGETEPEAERQRQTLLRSAIAEEADQALARNLAAVDRLRGQGKDLRAALEDVGYRLVQCYCDERSWALRRLLYAELNAFPDLLDIIRAAEPPIP